MPEAYPHPLSPAEAAECFGPSAERDRAEPQPDDLLTLWQVQAAAAELWLNAWLAMPAALLRSIQP